MRLKTFVCFVQSATWCLKMKMLLQKLNENHTYKHIHPLVISISQVIEKCLSHYKQIWNKYKLYIYVECSMDLDVGYRVKFSFAFFFKHFLLMLYWHSNTNEQHLNEKFNGKICTRNFSTRLIVVDCMYKCKCV